MPSTHLLVIIALAVVALLVLLWTFLRTQMGQGPRVILRGVGALLALAGLWFSGLAMLLGNGIRSIYDWAQRTTLSNSMIVGFSLLGTGLLFFVIGSFIKPRTKEAIEARRQPKPLKGSQQGTVRQSPAVAATPKAAAPAAASDEDREIEELLRNRGIE